MRLVLALLLCSCWAAADHGGTTKTDDDDEKLHVQQSSGSFVMPKGSGKSSSQDGDGVSPGAALKEGKLKNQEKPEREWFFIIVSGPEPASTTRQANITLRIAEAAKESGADSIVLRQQPFSQEILLEKVRAFKERLLEGWDRLSGALFILTSDVGDSGRSIPESQIAQLGLTLRNLLFQAGENSTRSFETALVGGRASRVSCPFSAGNLFRLTRKNEKRPDAALSRWLDRFREVTPYSFIPRSAQEWFLLWRSSRPSVPQPCLKATRERTITGFDDY